MSNNDNDGKPSSDYIWIIVLSVSAGVAVLGGAAAIVLFKLKRRKK